MSALTPEERRDETIEFVIRKYWPRPLMESVRQSLMDSFGEAYEAGEKAGRSAMQEEVVKTVDEFDGRKSFTSRTAIIEAIRALKP